MVNLLKVKEAVDTVTEQLESQLYRFNRKIPFYYSFLRSIYAKL